MDDDGCHRLRDLYDAQAEYFGQWAKEMETWHQAVAAQVLALATSLPAPPSPSQPVPPEPESA